MAKIINFDNSNRDGNKTKSGDRKSIVRRCAFIITIITTFCTISGVTVVSLLDKDWQEISEKYNNEGLELYDLGEYEEAIELYDKMVDYLKKALIYGHTSRISSWIYYQFTTFEGKSLDMPPGTLQAQTPAHSIEKE